MKKGENKSGLNSLFRRPQGTNSRDAQPPQNPQIAVPGQSGGISSEDDREVSGIPRAATVGGLSSFEASSKDVKTSRKQKICKKANLIWQGLHKLAKAIESIDIVPQPFDAPIKIFTAISDAAEVGVPPKHLSQILMFVPQKYFDNEEDLKDMMERLSARLVEANRTLLRSDDYSIDVAESSKQLAQLVVNEALEIHDIQHSSLTEKILGPDDVAQQINKCLDRLDRGTQEHHRSKLANGDSSYCQERAQGVGVYIDRAVILCSHRAL
ncbi:hypothetical protein GGX14DRAFT_401656 [Mycena pura]|uniref:Uncharacterized protein n=1 Tax=Mycena pura TaxID=153505 RepID=A0AAD6V2L3_9AGAR|nr:hypothetical protein GGX14DRAFT_401656 [Mycena pura]